MSKLIPVSVPTGPFNTKGLLNQVISMSPDKTLNILEMRQRCKILDAIEAADTSFLLEDDQHRLLVECLQKFPFNLANKQLLQTIDDVLNAKDGPVITKAMRDAALHAGMETSKAAAKAAKAAAVAAAAVAFPDKAA